ncbi:hypothetical protein GCM10022222_81210 [Amycolatopsis ultiminotia]|uniref:Carbon monoxide dehydrogenase subunit G n=1 Tax=Amycolatopsis ultiminotia TaxID=543629 RepID=A0ABP6YI80_9PSEU
MRLDHEFTVPASLDEVWQAVIDPERVAPCMPGAALTKVEGDSFAGTVKVKLGPISLLYKGNGEFLEKDEAARKVVIKASGKDSRGAGTAAATVTLTLTEHDGGGTHGAVATDLSITGRPAQFGRGMISEVGGKILDTFAGNLARSLATPPTEDAAATAGAKEAERPAAGTGEPTTTGAAGATGKPASAGQPDTAAKPGGSGGADAAGKSGGAGGADAAGKSGGAGRADAAGKSGGAGGADAAGKSGGAGRADAAGKSGGAGKAGVTGGAGAARGAGVADESGGAGRPGEAGESGGVGVAGGATGVGAAAAVGGAAAAAAKDAQSGGSEKAAGSAEGAEKPRLRSVPAGGSTGEAEPIDLLDYAGQSVAKRLIPVAAGAVVLVVILAIVRTLRRR